MPLIKPEIQKVLRDAGLLKKSSTEESAPELTLQDRFEAAGFGVQDTIEELVGIAKNSGNEGIRLRAIEASLKVQGMLKEKDVQALPSFTIVIQPPATGSSESLLNLHPGLPQGVNPILLPRQLLNQYESSKKEN